MSKPGEYIHSDVCGPVPVESLGGARPFYVLFKDDSTEFRFVYFLRHKSDVYERFVEFERLIANKFGHTIKTLRTDNGLEYRNARMDEYRKKKGITLEATAPYTPEQNGRSKRDNRTIVEAARTLLQAKGLPSQLWAEATATAVYTLNRTGQSRNGGSRTPYELWTGRKPDHSHMRIFGSDAYVYIPKQKVTKFEARAEKRILVGYDSESPNYRVYDPVTKRISISRHVAFNERGQGEPTIPAEKEVEFTLPSLDVNDEERGTRDGNGAAVSDEEAEDDQDENEAELKAPQQKKTVTPRELRNRESIWPPTRYALYTEYDVPETYQEAMSGAEASQCSCGRKQLKMSSKLIRRTGPGRSCNEYRKRRP